MGGPILLSTKLVPPTRPERWVTRDRLLDLLERGRPRRLCVLRGGAGAGKTILASQWHERLTASGARVGWLTLEEEDDAPSTFLAYLCTALSQSDPSLDLRPPLLEDPADPEWPRRAGTAIVNELAAADGPHHLFLDDLHRLGEARVIALLRFVLEHTPGLLSVVVATRSVPPLPLATWRAHGEVLEIGPRELPFDREESLHFMSRLKAVPLDAPLLEALHTRTEGWPAALELTAQALRRRSDPEGLLRELTSSHTELADYLAENVLSHLDSRWVDLLEATSVVERLNPDLAAELSGLADAAEILSELEREGLLLEPLDAEGGWYRYHQLTAAHLRRRLAARDPDAPAVLHRKASRWFEARGLVREAVRHAVAAGDTGRALELVRPRARSFVEQGLMPVLFELLDLLQGARSPEIELSAAWAHCLLHRPEPAEEALQRATATAGPDGISDAEASLIRAINLGCQDRMEEAEPYLDRGDRSPGDDPFVCGVRANARAYLELHRFRYEAALASLREGRSHQRRGQGSFSEIYGICFEGFVHRIRGHLDRAAQLFEDAHELACRTSDPRSHGARISAAFLGDVRYTQGRLAEARNLLQEARRLGRDILVPEIALATWAPLARLEAAEGNPHRALEVLDEAADLAAALDLERLDAAVLEERLRLLLVLGDVEAAEALAPHPPEEAPPETSIACRGWELRRLGQARVDIARRRPERAAAILEDLVDRAIRSQRRRFGLRLHLAAARAYHARGDTTAARRHLKEALGLAEAQQVVSPLADESAGPLLSLFDRLPVAPGFEARVRDALVGTRRPSARGRANDLTDRELEVLRLVDKGLSNKEIASVLSLGLDTVKWHLKNAYRKLGVSSRTEAAFVARTDLLL